MPRPQRLDFKGAIHYVHVRGRAGASIFFEAAMLDGRPKEYCANAPRVQQFLRLVGGPLMECGAGLYGYCVLPNAASLLLQTAGAPLDRLMQRVCGPFSRYLRASGTRGGMRDSTPGPFAGRYQSKVIAPEYLPHALRRVHALASVGGLSRSGVYPFSSEQAYMGGAAHASLDMAEMWANLEMKGFFGAHGYRNFMSRAETPYIANLFEKGSPLDARIVGSRTFVAQALDRAAHPPTAPTREQLIAVVAELLQRSPPDIYSATRVGVLGRSLVAWYGIRAGAGSLSEIARWFSVTAATLGRGIRYYRKSAPGYFESGALPRVVEKAGTEF